MLQKENKTESNLSTATRGKLSYGWVVAVAGAFILFIAGNFPFSFGVFIKPLVNKFSWSRASISIGVTTSSITSGLTSPIVGVLSDRYGSRKLILIGISLVGLSYLLASRMTSLWHLYLFLGGLTGIGTATFLIPVVSTATKWFGSKSGLANGIILSGFGWAQTIIPLIATYLILQYGWERCFIILGIAALVLGTLSWSFIRIPPDTMNQPLTEPRQENTPKASKTPTRSEDDYTFSEALRTPTLWTLLLITMVVAASYHMVVIHIVAAAIDTSLTPEAAAIILTLSGITNTLGKLTIGGLATKIGNKTTLALCLAIQALALFFLARASDLPAFYITAAVYGLAFGGVFPLMPTLAGSFFGTRSIGSIFGVTNTAYTLGAAIGPLLGGYTFDVTGSYSIAFFTAAIAITITLLLCLLLKPPQRKALIT